MKKYFYIIFSAIVAVLSLSLLSCNSNDNDELNHKMSYDVLQINGQNYACYGNRSGATFSSIWNLSTHRGEINLPCGKLSDAQKGEYDYDFYFVITLEGNQDLKKGSKLENFSPTFLELGDGNNFNYTSGSATITDKRDDMYITIKFNSFKFGKGSESYTLNGTVQLSLDED